MALAGLDGRFLEVNRALCQLLGYSEEQLSLTTIRAITHPHDVGGMLAGTRQLLARETTRFQAEQRYLHADGYAGWALVSISLMRDPNGRPLYRARPQHGPQGRCRRGREPGTLGYAFGPGLRPGPGELPVPADPGGGSDPVVSRI